MTKVIINADDFGVSRDVNKAVELAFLKGSLSSASLIVNAPCAREAAALSRTKLKDMPVGIHLNLTHCRAICNPKDIPLLARRDGAFKNGFLKLLLLPWIKPAAFKKQARLEMEAQIQKMRSWHIRPRHIDAHRHIQMIPAVFKIAAELKRKYGIPRIRIVNESIIHTLMSGGDFHFLIDGGLIKYCVLKLLYHWNQFHSQTYFYSILHTGRLFGKNVAAIRLPKKYKEIEICVHPSQANRDKKDCPADAAQRCDNPSKEFETAIKPIRVKAL